MIEGPGFWFRYREDEVTRQQVRPGTARRVWPYLRRYRGPMVLLVVFTAVDSAIVVVSPLILRLIIDDGILRHRESVVVALALTVAGLALVDAGAEYVRSWYSDWIGESLVLELRTSVFRHVLRQPLAFFTRTQTGSLVSRMDDDINETQRAVGGLMSESLSMLLNLVLVLAAMFWLSWQLSLIALVVIPLFVLPGKVAGKRAQRLLRQEMQLHGELSAMTAERSDVSGALLAMLYGRPEEDAGVFTGKASRIRDLAVARRRRHGAALRVHHAARGAGHGPGVRAGRDAGHSRRVPGRHAGGVHRAGVAAVRAAEHHVRPAGWKSSPRWSALTASSRSSTWSR